MCRDYTLLRHCLRLCKGGVNWFDNFHIVWSVVITLFILEIIQILSLSHDSLILENHFFQFLPFFSSRFMSNQDSLTSIKTKNGKSVSLSIVNVSIILRTTATLRQWIPVNSTLNSVMITNENWLRYALNKMSFYIVFIWMLA